jgi:hypothetical protein
MKSQGSALKARKTLQSQNRMSAKNRLAINSLEFVHGRLNKSGKARSKSEAAEEAEHMIDVMLAPKKRRLMRPVPTDAP